MFRRQDYKDFDLSVPMAYSGAGDKLYLAALSPSTPEKEADRAVKGLIELPGKALEDK